MSVLTGNEFMAATQAYDWAKRRYSPKQQIAAAMATYLEIKLKWEGKRAGAVAIRWLS